MDRGLARDLRKKDVLLRAAGLVVAAFLALLGPALAGENKPNTAAPTPAEPPPAPLYCLPWPGGVSHICYQGNFGKLTHMIGQQNNYAWDFGMNPGEPVAAARPGKVVMVDLRGNDTAKADKDKENTIRILHDDGSFGVYAHLQTGSAKVSKGDWVEAGEVIAASGDMHHTHFVVWDGKTMRSIPAAFKEVKENGGVPQEKRTYRSAAPKVTAESVAAAAGLLVRAAAERTKGHAGIALKLYQQVANGTGAGGINRKHAEEVVAELAQAGLEQVTEAAAKAAAGDRVAARKALDALVGDFRGTPVEAAARQKITELAQVK